MSNSRYSAVVLLIEYRPTLSPLCLMLSAISCVRCCRAGLSLGPGSLERIRGLLWSLKSAIALT